MFISNELRVMSEESILLRSARNDKGILALVVILLFVIVPLNALTLTFKQTAKITQPAIRVCDLVDSWEGEQADFLDIRDIVLAELPYQQRVLNLNSGVVSEKMREHTSAELTFPRSVIAVRWEDSTLSADRIRQEAEDFISRYYSLGDEAEVTIVNIPRVAIPNDDVRIAFEKSKTTDEVNYTRLDGKVFLLDNNTPITAFNVIARVQQRQSVYQANRSIKRGEKIDESDFIRVSIVTNANSNYITDVVAMSNSTATELIAGRFISKGSLLKTTDVATSPFVQRNQIITVVVQSPALQLTYEALSKADGWLGDRIMMQNPDSKQIFYAQVIEKNKVLIKLED